jgi:hypothetical protein
MKWYVLLAAWSGLLFLVCLLTPGHATCIDLPDGTSSCTEGPYPAPAEKAGGFHVSFSASPGITFSDQLSYRGMGYVDLDLPAYSDEKKALDSLLFSIWGKLERIQDIAFFLQTHDFDTTAEGQVTLSDGTCWQVISEHGIIRTEAIV